MDLQPNMTVVLSQRASRPINYTLNSVSHEHQGVWSCYDDGTLPHVSSMPWHHFLWVEDDSAHVTIHVLSHNRTQFLHNELLTVGCRLPQGEHDHWRLMRFNKWEGMLEACPGAQVSGEVLSCSERMVYPWADRLYWCQSDLGQRSNALNISNTVISSVLEAPPLPVTEGDDIPLRCLKRDRKTGNVAPASAIFKHDDQYISLSNDGTFTVKNVTKENEGLYECRVEDEVYTGKVYVTVRARRQEQKGH
ncbi:uncharacterized protein [Eucyclogobius newberryi]|uniref:uncharacterized protein n=1 Tax=Eucyclogobius newberryi TaxID=166745 RepID=UPI003B5C5A93